MATPVEFHSYHLGVDDVQMGLHSKVDEVTPTRLPREVRVC